MAIPALKLPDAEIYSPTDVIKPTPGRPLQGLAAMLMQRRGQKMYNEQLGNVNSQMERMQAAELAAQDRKVYLEQAHNLANQDVISAFDPAQFGVQADNTRLTVRDTAGLNKRLSDSGKTDMETITGYRNNGIQPSIEYLETKLGGPFGNPVSIDDLQYMTPEAKAKKTTADAQYLDAQANMIDAKNPNKYNRRSGGSGGETATVVLSPFGGPPQVTYRVPAGQEGKYLQGAQSQAQTPGDQVAARIVNRKLDTIVGDDGQFITLGSGKKINKQTGVIQ